MLSIHGMRMGCTDIQSKPREWLKIKFALVILLHSTTCALEYRVHILHGLSQQINLGSQVGRQQSFKEVQYYLSVISVKCKSINNLQSGRIVQLFFWLLIIKDSW